MGWVTLKGGRRVHIEDGESVSDAIKRYTKQEKVPGKESLKQARKAAADDVANLAQEIGNLRKKMEATKSDSEYRKLRKKMEVLQERELELLKKWREVAPKERRSRTSRKGKNISTIEVDQSILDDIDW